MKRLLATVAVALALTVAGPARADRDYLIYKVRPGDTLALLAAEYYGDRTHAVFIMVANKLDHPRALKPGEKLRLPVSRVVTVAVGDTFEGLAQAYLGDKRRARYLAEFNGLDPADSLAAGAQLTIPFHVVHTAAGEESLGSIAAAYFGDSKNGPLLRGYNFLDRDTLAAGESIVIPINHVKVRASAMPPVDAESKARTQKREQMMEIATRALPRAADAWRAGAYADVKRELIAVDLDFVDGDRAAALGQLLGAAYVALGDEVSARAAFQRVIERRPRTTMSVYWYSPRIVAVWTKAGGQLADDS
ncbi:MAG: LysM peptidoglycan-binding domain-containing protein [Myxococcales bacterium]|nr:LysM peptidoglycan-binding domain-containing protein [Myxococcales bacterium]